LPKFLEHLALNMPILGKKLNSLYADHVIDNYKITNEFSGLNFQQTSEVIRLYGLY